MPVGVLVVDDSPFLRHVIKLMLESDPRLEVVGEAVNGAEAVKMTAALQPDVITMDIEMPVMDGIAATRRIMQRYPRPILMFSSLTVEGAEATLAALAAGAVDYLPKQFEEVSWNRDKVAELLCDRVYTIAHHGAARRSDAASSHGQNQVSSFLKPWVREAIKLVAIGASTGGPLALQELLTRLPANFPYPLLLVQHMPGNFTPSFARRMNQLSAITVKEAQDGDELLPARALLAPGGKQMSVVRQAGRYVVRLHDAEPDQVYAPSVDFTFNSVAAAMPGQTLAVVLTGMGEDGREGCGKLKSGGATVWTQDEAGCVVYGMPAAVAEAGLSDRVLDISEMAEALSQLPRSRG